MILMRYRQIRMMNLMVTSTSNQADDHLHAWLESVLEITEEYILMMLVHKNIVILLAALYADNAIYSDIVLRCPNPACE